MIRSIMCMLAVAEAPGDGPRTFGGQGRIVRNQVLNAASADARAVLGLPDPEWLACAERKIICGQTPEASSTQVFGPKGLRTDVNLLVSAQDLWTVSEACWSNLYLRRMVVGPQAILVKATVRSAVDNKDGSWVSNFIEQARAYVETT